MGWAASDGKQGVNGRSYSMWEPEPAQARGREEAEADAGRAQGGAAALDWIGCAVMLCAHVAGRLGVANPLESSGKGGTDGTRRSS